MENRAYPRDEEGYYTLGSLVSFFGGKLVAFECVSDGRERVSEIVIDSRAVKRGDLFVALVGGKADGERYASEAFERGAVAVLCRHGGSERIGARGLYIEVEDPLSALTRAAARVRKCSGAQVVGITGSVGKTTVKELCISVLSTRYAVDGTRLNYNNQLGLSISILNAFGVAKMSELRGKSQEKSRRYLVLEMGISHKGDMDELVRIALPDVAVITNIGSMHSEYLGGREGIAREKARIAASGARLVVCGDDPMLLWEIFRYIRREDVRVLSYGKNVEGVIYGMRVSALEERGCFSVTRNADNTEIGRFTAPIVGEHGIWDSALAVTLGYETGAYLDKIQSVFNRYSAVPLRQEIRRIGDTVRIVDCYNSGPESVRAVLSALDVYAEKYGATRRVAVLGDMLELGETSKSEHFKLGTELSEYGIGLLFTVGDESRAIALGAISGGISQANVFSFGGNADFVKVRAEIESRLCSGDIILYKASRSIGLERLVEEEGCL